MFSSRWLLAPIFLGMIVVIAIIFIKFFQLLIGFIPESMGMSFEEVAMGALNLLDLALLGNLILLVTFSGYENFVSKINPAQDHKDRPSWMGNLDFSGLKLKIVGSIVVISLIELLHDFLEAAQGVDPNIEFWRILLHIVFVISGVLFALMDYISAKSKTEE
ncbi:TIGR00645 family protein [Methanobrevibacter sp. TMH8]|uniref:TIGR00645 family protein n=1 Tax=Methanobrevibacter sp. TMH8 TaxID=2848611 RepID=UPI001CCDE0E2